MGQNKRNLISAENISQMPPLAIEDADILIYGKHQTHSAFYHRPSTQRHMPVQRAYWRERILITNTNRVANSILEPLTTIQEQMCVNTKQMGTVLLMFQSRETPSIIATYTSKLPTYCTNCTNHLISYNELSTAIPTTQPTEPIGQHTYPLNDTQASSFDPKS